MTPAALRYDMYDRELYASPYETFRRLREEAPLYYNEEYDFYALSRPDEWYTFQETVSTGQIKGQPPSPGTHLLGLFPVGSGKGITGELVWPRVPLELLGRGEAPAGLPTDPVEMRRALLALHDRYLDAFFDKFDVVSIDLLDRVVQEWYAFAELRITVTPRGSQGPTLAFHTAEYDVAAKDGRFIVRIGHGTDLAEMA